MQQHSFYAPTDEFVAKHRLHVDEAEAWVSLYNHEDAYQATKFITFNKDTGAIRLGFYATPEDMLGSVKFEGYLPDEAALELLLKWTNW